MTSGIRLTRYVDQRLGVLRYVASNTIPPEIFNRLVAEDEQRRKEARMAQKNGAVAERNAAIEAARAEGFAFGAAEERKRFAAITTSDEAKDRPSQAMAFALDTDLSAEKVAALLAKAPKEASADTGYQTIAQRAAAQKEIGGSATAMQFLGSDGAANARQTWDAAMKKAKLK
ncbi:hypothetical protein BMI86_00045 [Thioclava sp. DLFJ5-1]|uniref:hypothetical protein n=1 Tax=Thioclava sp. DLFJ5-1 TaxID=1915314 RepID=UPI000998DB16|nr:hypothetical protein [Thioclava sp. DLFJ5-1]OOY21026.1 hypothetical protein BMI86_00045 [Thioclava sp. DLFJ5-1]